MAISLVTTGTLAYDTNSASRVLSYGATTQAGDIFHVQIVARGASVTVTNAQGGTVLLTGQYISSSNSGSVLLWEAPASGAGSVTFTISSSLQGSIAWAQYRGVDTASPALSAFSGAYAVGELWTAPTFSLAETGYVVGGLMIPSGSRDGVPQTSGWTPLTQALNRRGHIAERGEHPAGAVAAAAFAASPTNYMDGYAYQFALRPGGGGPPVEDERGVGKQITYSDTTWLIAADDSGVGNPQRWHKPNQKAFWNFGDRWDGVIPVSVGSGHQLVTDLHGLNVAGATIDTRSNVRPTIAVGSNRVAIYRTNDSTPRVSTYTHSSGTYTASVTDATGPFQTDDNDASPIALTYTSNGHLWAAQYQSSVVRVSKSTDDGATWSAAATVLSSLPATTGIVTLDQVGTDLVMVVTHNGAGQAQARRIAISGAPSSAWTSMDPPSVSPAEADDHASSLVVGNALYVAMKTTGPTASDPLIYVARWLSGSWTRYNVVMGPDTGDRPSRPSLASDGTTLWLIYGHINAARLSTSAAFLSNLNSWTAPTALFATGDHSDGAITPTGVSDVPMILAHNRSTGKITSMLLPELVSEGNATLTYSWAGLAYEDTFRASCKTVGASGVRLVTASDAQLTTDRVVSSTVAPDADGWAKASVSGLPAGTRHYGWELDHGGMTTTPTQGTFTLGQTSFRFAFGSCLDSGLNNDTLTRVLAHTPDMFFHLGDWHYEDNESTAQSSHRNDIEMQLAANTGLRNLIASTPSLYVRSDHDAGGGNNALPGAYTVANRDAYKQVVPHPTLSNADGLYYSFVVGRVRFIVTDQRYLRTTTSMLGTTQQAWLLNELSQPEPVKMWVQDSTFITDEAPEGEDKWSDYSTDRNAIRDYINGNDVGQVITVHGDQHALAADDGTNNDWGGFPTFCAAPFGRASSHKSSSWSHGIWPTTPSATFVRQYGIVDVTDTGDTITVDFSGYDTGDIERVSLSVEVSTVTVEDPGDPVAAYGFNEGAGSVSPANIGSWGDATAIPGWGAGRYGGSALSSTGTGAVVPVEAQTDFTLMLDVFLSAGSGWRSIIEAPGGAFYLELEGLTVDVWSNPNTALQGGALSTGWNHIAITATTGESRLVVNGTTVVTSVNKANLPSGAYYVGGSPGQPLDCRVDNLRVYDSALSDAAIQSIMGTEVEGAAEVPSGWKFITSGGLVPLTPHIVTGPSADLRSEIIANVYGAHDAIPRGVPLGYSWREDADTDPNADSTQYQEYGAVNIWGQAFATDATTAYTARVQVRRPRLWFHNGSEWAEASITPGTLSGAYYTGDFQSGATNATTQQDAPGEWSGPLSGLNGEPDAFHFWWDGMFPRTPIPQNCQGILVSQEMRLTNTAGANIIATSGADLFATPETVVDPQGWNHGIPNPRMIWVTDQWSRFWTTTSSLSRLNNTPSPTY